MSSDLIEFLRARLDEDERIAHAALGLLGMVTDWHEVDVLRKRGLTRADAHHVARWSSQRVLREVAAKRRILALAEDISTSGAEFADQDFATLTHALAAPYADHPDYQPAWASDGVAT